MPLYWLSVAAPLGPDYKLWVAFGTGKAFCYLAAYKLAIALATNKAQVLSMFLALTAWCNTVSSFVGKGKKQCGQLGMCMQPQLTDAMLKLSCAPSDIQQD